MILILNLILQPLQSFNYPFFRSIDHGPMNRAKFAVVDVVNAFSILEGGAREGIARMTHVRFRFLGRETQRAATKTARARSLIIIYFLFRLLAPGHPFINNNNITITTTQQ